MARIQPTREALLHALDKEFAVLADQPSRSMLRAATRRAAHQLLDRPCIFEDPIAVGLVPEASQHAILEAVDEHRAPLSTLLRGVYAFRSRFAEDRLAKAALRGVCQYVVVGAGLETFAWRQPAFARDMRVFYLDHPSSLTWTTERFRRRGLTPPPNLSFVSVDLEVRELAARLNEHGFRHEAGAFFSALGVTQYLSRGAVEAIFRFAASLRLQSEIVFSFAPPDDELDGEELAAAIHGATLNHSMGEPWITRLGPTEAFGLLNDLGFGEVFHLTPKRAQQFYFADREDGLRAPKFEQLMAATV
jgi:methyltransferase (TIGR00027 family)